MIREHCQFDDSPWMSEQDRALIRRATLRLLAGSLGVYAAGVIAAGATALMTSDAWQLFLFGFGSAAAFAAWRTVRWPDVAARYLTFGAVLLLSCSVNRVLYVADYAIAGSRLEEWPFPVADPVNAVFKGEVLTVAGTLITVLTWIAAGGLRVSPVTMLRKLGVYRLELVAIYAMSVAGVLATTYYPQAAGGLGQLLPSLQTMGTIAAVLIPLARFRRARYIVPIGLLLSTPFLMVSAGSGMKESIIVAILPLGAFVWASIRSLITRSIFVLASIVGLSLVTSYIGYFRDAVWLDRSGTATTEQALLDYFDAMQREGVVSTVAEGWTRFLKRNNASIARGWAVAIADEQAMQPELVFGPLAYVFIPRMLWPEKPANRQGWEYSGLVFGPAFTEWSDSSTAAGFYSSLYLGFGWTAYVVGAVLAGYLLAKTAVVAKRWGGDFAVGLFGLALVPYALRMDEQFPVGVFSAPIIMLAYILAVSLVVKTLALRRASAIS